ncbi:MAG: carbohydrate binding domain-containing protein [Treponema sp.]|nr:carbohydrate binding domain-containing protein [Treponema sp.]
MKIRGLLICVIVLASVFAGCGGTGDGDEAPPGTTGANLVVNGGFEDDFSGWTISSGQDLIFFIDPVIKAVGDKSLKIIDCEWQGVIYQYINVEPDTEYVFAMSCLVSRDDSQPYGALVKIASDLSSATPFFQINAAGTGWKSYRESFNSGSNSQICLSINGNESEFYVDRISLYQKN